MTDTGNRASKTSRTQDTHFSNGLSITKIQFLKALDYHCQSLTLIVLRPLLICRLTVLSLALRWQPAEKVCYKN